MMTKRMVTGMEKLAGAIGWMMLAMVVALGVTGCGRDPLMAKAKKAEKEGNINFFGFYTGMPRADADALVARHGLRGVDGLVNFALSFDLGFYAQFGLDNASMFHENPETHEVYAMLFSIQDVQRMTKTGTFKELSKAVAKQVGELDYDGKVAKRKTWNGVALYISKEQQFCILFDEHRAKSARKAKERLALEAQRQKAAKAKAEVDALNEKIRAGETRTPGDTKTITLPGGATMEMVWCPPGAFWMGNGYSLRVTLSKGFWMATTEVTQAQWKSVMGKRPSRIGEGDNYPVDSVDWDECRKFCKKTGMRLPTEAEWEYACRAGTTGDYTESLDQMGWYGGNWTHEVGQKKPNAWGLYDMHGNVWEWCEDRWIWEEDYPKGVVTDPKGAPSGLDRVLRGGGASQGPDGRNSTARRSHGTYGCCVGFRPVMDLPAE